MLVMYWLAMTREPIPFKQGKERMTLSNKLLLIPLIIFMCLLFYIYLFIYVSRPQYS